LATPQNIEETL